MTGAFQWPINNDTLGSAACLSKNVKELQMRYIIPYVLLYFLSRMFEYSTFF